jgi:hypothetical protein
MVRGSVTVGDTKSPGRLPLLTRFLTLLTRVAPDGPAVYVQGTDTGSAASDPAATKPAFTAAIDFGDIRTA